MPDNERHEIELAAYKALIEKLGYAKVDDKPELEDNLDR